MDVAFAYRHCERVTRVEARNFSYGIRLLPGPKRRALSAVYALARRIDDIGDDESVDAGLRLDRLERVRERLRSMDEVSDDPVLIALSDTARRYLIPVGAFGELIDGCVADVSGTTYTTFDELVGYCRCVAGSVGRLSLGVFGAHDPEAASPVADALGVALQLTNILRDIAEDLAAGRVYLPAEDLARFGIAPNFGVDLAAAGNRAGSGNGAGSGEHVGLADLEGLGEGAGSGVLLGVGEQGGSLESRAALGVGGAGAFGELVRFEVGRARGYYDEGFELLSMLDRRSAACTAAMAGIYRRLLDRIAADPAAVLRGRMSLPGREKAVIAARSLIGSAA